MKSRRLHRAVGLALILLVPVQAGCGEKGTFYFSPVPAVSRPGSRPALRCQGPDRAITSDAPARTEGDAGRFAESDRSMEAAIDGESQYDVWLREHRITSQ